MTIISDEELVYALRNNVGVSDYSRVAANLAADRIEELLKQRGAIMSFNHATNQENYRYQEWTRDAEDKMAKAVEAIKIALTGWQSELVQYEMAEELDEMAAVKEVLAELEKDT